MVGSNVPPLSTICIFVPGSRGAFGVAGPRDMKKPLGEYFGI